MERNLVLLGFMGTGKTTVGKQLAAKLQREFIDIDQLLEERLGVSIAEFFARQGEKAFRKLEKEAISTAARRKNLVIATGGGAVLDRDNVVALQENGLLILLTAEPETIAQRLAGDKSRPILGREGSIGKISELLALRDWAYRRAAEITVATDGLDAAEVALKILESLGPGLSPLTNSPF